MVFGIGCFNWKLSYMEYKNFNFIVNIQSSKKREVIDITNLIESQIPQGFDSGICHLFLLHTTAGITTADLDPGTDLDMIDIFNKLVPSLNFRHPHNPDHMPDHFLSSLVGTSLSVPVSSGRLLLGTWQRVVLCEFDGPRDRELSLTFISS